MATLIDELIPDPDFASAHSILVGAPTERVAEAVDDYRLEHRFLRLLLRARGLSPPDRLRDTLLEQGFNVLAEAPGREVVVGIAGRFWALYEPSALIRTPDAEAFRSHATPGTARAAACFRFEPVGEGETRLSTETRVDCVDAAARRRFALYWLLIKPFSGWIRSEVLEGIRRHALARKG